jgi:hypothetical protein
VSDLAPGDAYYVAAYDFSFDRKMYLLAKREKVEVKSGETSALEITDIAGAPEAAPPPTVPTVTDPVTGIIVKVSADGKSLSATEKDGKEIWNAKLVPDGNPCAIRSLSVVNGPRAPTEVFRDDGTYVPILEARCNRVKAGTALFKLDLKTGKLMKAVVEE